MKPDFKVDFTKKDVVKTVCLTVVLLLVLVLGETFGYVSADEVSEENLWLNMEAYEDSENYNASNANVAYIRPQTTSAETNAILGSNAVLNHTYSFTGAETPSTFNMSDVKYYVITGDILSSTWRLYMFTTDDCHIYMDGSAHQFVVDTGKNSSKFYVCDIQSWSDGTNLVSPYAVFPDTCSANDTVYYSIGNFSMYYTRVTMSNSNYILASNMDILTYQGSLQQPTILYEYIDWLAGNTNNNIVNVNYLYGNAHSLGGFDNLEGIGTGIGGGDNTDETTENNMYLQDSKWSFSIPKWSNLIGYSGNATFSASLNEFQQENLSDFYLRFTFSIHTSQSYVNDPGVSGGGHDTANVSQSSSGATGYVSGIYKYKDSLTSNEYLDVSLQDFYNMGSSKAFMTLNGIFDRCYKVGFSGNMSDTSFINWYNTAVNSAEYTTTKATLYCYATLYDSNGNSSGNCTYYYDLLNGSSGITDTSMSVNNNPYVDEDGNVSTTIPDTETTTENSYNGNGVNVTQTVTVNNDSGDGKSWLWTLITSLITSGSDNETISEAGMSDTLINFTGINPWLSLMSTTLGFVPATVWTTLSACFIVVMGILVVAFVLRIILDLL